MKKTSSLVIAAAAVAMALVSCTKEITANKEEGKGINADGTRTLTVSFATKATKTTLLDDRITPVWAEGDQISLNGTPYDVPAEAVGTSTCTITTGIQGDITAVYPADAYQSTAPYFKVKDKQDGSFGCANICVAQAAAGVNTLTFENVTAVFEVTVPDGTTKLTVTSLGKIDSETGQRGKDADDIVAINTTETGAAANVITVEKEDKGAFEEGPVYVAVAVDPENGVLLADLNFDIQYKDSESKEHYAQGGVSPNYIKSKGQEPLEYKAAAGTIYTPVLHEYVLLLVDGKKWATMNVGASLPTDYGLYFAWGATTGHEANEERTAFKESYSFDGANLPFAVLNNEGAPRFTKYYPSDQPYRADNFPGDTKTTLYLEDDAAFWNWGGAWRMPTKDDFDTFILGASYTSGNFEHKGVTFPPAGYGQSNTIRVASNGYYWSSSLNTDDAQKSYDLVFSNSSGVKTDSGYRYCGRSVRPVSE